LGDWFSFRTYFLTSKASPNDRGIIVIVIIIGEAKLVSHNGGIIAQTYLSSADSAGFSGLMDHSVHTAGITRNGSLCLASHADVHELIPRYYRLALIGVVVNLVLINDNRNRGMTSSCGRGQQTHIPVSRLNLPRLKTDR